jgi:LuxR family maltose regulon positive regulatory protein
VSTPILTTKLNIPPIRPNLVPRSRLIERLRAGIHNKLTLISASAGFGKTTLAAEWLRDEKRAVAWITLDENDNDPARFLVYFLAALNQIDQHAGEATKALLQALQPPPPDFLMTTLVNEIAAIHHPFILAIDDYHVIQTLPIHQQLAFIVEHQPAQMHLAIITREDPPLPIARLRARGHLVEIRQQDLRFSLDECTEFLNQVMGLNLPPTDIAALEHRTEGWIAGLQLAALSMRGRDDLSGFIEAFTGSSHFVLDYLIEEVFRQQSIEVQDFLLKTSILERLSGSLCDAVAGRTDSRSLLEQLEHANLFIIPFDQSCTWYRYHRLFADFLRQRLQITESISESALHRLACQWFANEGLFSEAIHHALAGADWERAAELIGEQSVSMLRRGELVTFLGWLKSLPEDVIRARPHLRRDYGWALALTGQLEAAAPILDCAERTSQNDDEQLGQVMVAQAYLARVRGDNPRAIELSKRALELVSETDVLHRGLAMFTLGFSLFSAGHIAEAEPALMGACEAARVSGNDYARQTALGLLGAIQKNQGRLRRAAEFCQQALDEAHGSPTAAQVRIFLGSILYEWNDLDA